MSEEVLNEISDAFSKIDMPKLIRSAAIVLLAVICLCAVFMPPN